MIVAYPLSDLTFFGLGQLRRFAELSRRDARGKRLGDALEQAMIAELFRRDRLLDDPTSTFDLASEQWTDDELLDAMHASTSHIRCQQFTDESATAFFGCLNTTLSAAVGARLRGLRKTLELSCHH
jgi:hypothetical protein